MRFYLIAAIALTVFAEPAFSGDADRGRMVASQAGCPACHGPSGISGDPMVPNLAGQTESYLSQQLRRFRAPPSDELAATWAPHRSDHTMNAKAGALSDHDVDDLAAHYSALPCGGPVSGPEPAALDSAPACLWCHESEDKRRQMHAPLLFGQKRDYLARQLRLLRAAARGHHGLEADRGHPDMNPQAVRLTIQEIDKLADYLSKRNCR